MPSMLINTSGLVPHGQSYARITMSVHSIVLSLLVSTTLACSPEGYRGNVPLDEMAYKSAIIALGTVIRNYPVSADNNSYIAELQVICTYKGGPLPELVNISNAGSWPGLCGYKNFTVGTEYIAFLDDDGVSYTQRYDQTTPSKPALEEFLTFCGLSLEYSNSSNEIGICVPPKQDCKSYKDSLPSPPLPSKEHAVPAPPIDTGRRKEEPPLFMDPISSGEVPFSTEETGLLMSTMTSLEDEATEEPEKEVTTRKRKEGGCEGQKREELAGEASGIRTAVSTVCLCLLTVMLSLN